MQNNVLHVFTLVTILRFNILINFFNVFREWHALHATRSATTKLSLCPSVCLTNAWIVTKPKSVQIFIPYEKNSQPSFLRRRMVGVALLPETFGQADSVGA